MSNLMNEFENRFTMEFFSCGWSDVEAKPEEPQKTEIIAVSSRKELSALQAELDMLQENIENIAQKTLRLSNLAKLYKN